MVPAAYAFLESLPLTANGKLDERALPVATIAHSREPATAGGTPLQRTIAAAWSRVLGVENVGLDESFFDLGGTSLSLLRRARGAARAARAAAVAHRRLVPASDRADARRLSRKRRRAQTAHASGGARRAPAAGDGPAQRYLKKIAPVACTLRRKILSPLVT